MAGVTTAAFMLLAAAQVSGAASAVPPDGPRIPPATLDESLEITGEDVDAQQVKTRMFIPVRVNGRGPYRFLVDSGADRTVIGSDLARRLALTPGKPVNLRSMAGTSRVETVKIDKLSIGTSEMEDIAAPALPERYIGAQGLLGIDALADQRLKLDFDAKTITVQDSRIRQAPLPDEIVVTARRRNGQLILTQVSFNGQRVYAVIDTGAEVTIGNLALQSRVFRGRKPPPPRPITLISVTGEAVDANAATLPEVKVGGLTLRNVPVAFADAAPFALFGLADEPALLLGTDVLEIFRRVSLDFRNRRVRFAIRN